MAINAVGGSNNSSVVRTNSPKITIGDRGEGQVEGNMKNGAANNSILNQSQDIAPFGQIKKSPSNTLQPPDASTKQAGNIEEFMIKRGQNKNNDDSGGKGSLVNQTI